MKQRTLIVVSAGLSRPSSTRLLADRLSAAATGAAAGLGVTLEVQVIDRTLGFRDYVGDYQRQLFLIDHAGLPVKTVLEQLDLLGEQVVPVLRKEFAVGRPEHVPDAPTHESLVAAARARELSQDEQEQR